MHSDLLSWQLASLSQSVSSVLTGQMPGDIDGSFPNWKIQTRGHPPVEEDGRFSNPFMKNPDGESQGRKHYDAPMSKSWAPRRLMKPGQPAKGKEDRPEGTRKVPQPDRSEVGESLHPNPNSRRESRSRARPALLKKTALLAACRPAQQEAFCMRGVRSGYEWYREALG